MKKMLVIFSAALLFATFFSLAGCQGNKSVVTSNPSYSPENIEQLRAKMVGNWRGAWNKSWIWYILIKKVEAADQKLFVSMEISSKRSFLRDEVDSGFPSHSGKTELFLNEQGEPTFYLATSEKDLEFSFSLREDGLIVGRKLSKRYNANRFEYADFRPAM